VVPSFRSFRLASLLASIAFVAIGLSACGGAGSTHPPANGHSSIRRLVPKRPQATAVVADALAALDAQSSLRSLGKQRYELVIENTSGIGFINALSWAPPAGMQLIRVLTARGGRCEVVSGKISCQGVLDPPRCSCAGRVGLTIRFEARNYDSFSTGVLRITRMTPVPYVIPSAAGVRISPLAALPLCREHERNSAQHRCVHSGA
jgi:hypothetical protein